MPEVVCQSRCSVKVGTEKAFFDLSCGGRTAKQGVLLRRECSIRGMASSLLVRHLIIANTRQTHSSNELLSLTRHTPAFTMSFEQMLLVTHQNAICLPTTTSCSHSMPANGRVLYPPSTTTDTAVSDKPKHSILEIAYAASTPPKGWSSLQNYRALIA